MKNLIASIVFLIFCGNALASDEALSLLDQELGRRQLYFEQKMQIIENIKSEMKTARLANERLEIYKRMASAYYVFKYDSASHYVDKGLELAKRVQNNYYATSFTMMKAELLAISGFYHESVSIIEKVDTTLIDPGMLVEYYCAMFNIYNYWSAYCAGTPYAERYLQEAMACLKKAQKMMNIDYAYYNYMNGEYFLYVGKDPQKALYYYNKVLKEEEPTSRVYARSCFAMANTYRDLGDMQRFEEYLIKATVCDIKGCTMENLALQFLARLLYERDDKYLARAERYMSASLEDAQFYNNRLRILEISRTLPAITNAYQERLNKSSHFLKISIAVLVVLLLVVISGATVIYLQNKRLTENRKALAERNAQLSDAYEQQAELNSRLSTLNDRLMNTNKRRERLAKLYIDLTARYIDKLSKYQTLVQRKIKANQVQDLLSKMSSSRLSEEEATVFMNQFDRAFLDLYPTFIEEFNNLLEPDYQIETKQLRSLTTELRIFALIRLGVKESSEIAALLFYSPQTIYNYRSTVKSHAIDRENFEAQVAELCTIV